MLTLRPGTFMTTNGHKSIDVHAEIKKTTCIKYWQADNSDRIILDDEICKLIFQWISMKDKYAGLDLYEWLDKVGSGLLDPT